MKKIIGQQGEVRIIKIDAIPDDISTKDVERVPAGFIISHSENGNHHCLTGGAVLERTNDVPAGMRIIYAALENPADLVQDATVPHGRFSLPAGFYEFRISREYDPFAEQARQVAD